jgi:hypothetical protein
MRLISTYFILAIFLLTSCDNNKKENENRILNVETSQTKPFREYLKKLQVRQLPFYYKGWTEASFDAGTLYTLNQQSIDSLFFDIKDDNIKCYGILSDTTNFFGLIYFRIGDAPVPILATYSKSGQLLDKQDLLCNGCGSDCDLEYCSYAAHVKKNLDIYIADTLIYNGICDTLQENVIKSIDSTFIAYKTGKIEANGKINLGQLMSLRKKNSP